MTIAGSARATRLGGDLAPAIGVGFSDDPGSGEALAIVAPRDACWGADIGATIRYRLARRAEVFVVSDADLRNGDRAIEARGGIRMML